MSDENKCRRCGAAIELDPEVSNFLCDRCEETWDDMDSEYWGEFTGVPEFEEAANLILQGLVKMGFEPDEANFAGTPKRVSRAYTEIFSGVSRTQEKVDGLLNTAFPSNGHNDMVLETGIVAFSMCPHHLLPVEYHVAVAYVPNKDGQVLGISKLGRLAVLLAKQPMLQEDYTQSLVQALNKINPAGVAVLVEGEHLCMRMRGAKVTNGHLTTSAVSGCFDTDSSCRAEFMSLAAGRVKF